MLYLLVDVQLAHYHTLLVQERVTLKKAVESLTASVQQQETQHLAAADAQQRQLHAFNMALLEQAEELAALQALLGAPSRKRQSSRRRVTEDLVDSLNSLQVPSGLAFPTPHYTDNCVPCTAMCLAITAACYMYGLYVVHVSVLLQHLSYLTSNTSTYHIHLLGLGNVGLCCMAYVGC